MRAYLDYNATAPLWPEIGPAMVEALALPGNPSAVHESGRRARSHIEHARADVAALLRAKPAEIVFTSGGTEANALALRGSAVARLIVSAVEHPSVLDSARASGLPVTLIPVGVDGVIALDALSAALAAGGRALVSVMAANNETGVIQPIPDVVRLAREAGALVHVDAVQMAINADHWADADLVSVSAHKIGGPPGVGALVIRNGAALTPLLAGGQERRRRAGTENLPGIVGFGIATAKASEMRAAAARIAALRDKLETGVLALAPETVFFGAKARRLPGTSAFATPGSESAVKVIALDLAGIAVSAGAACSSGKVERSHVLTAMGVGVLAGEAMRVSLGWHTQPEEIEFFLDAYGAFLAQWRRRKAS